MKSRSIRALLVFGVSSLAAGVGFVLMTSLDRTSIRGNDIQRRSAPSDNVDRRQPFLFQSSESRAVGVGREKITREVERFSVVRDPHELNRLFKVHPKEVIDVLAGRALDNLDPKASDLLGRLLFDYLGERGEDYLEKELDGFVREWTRIGYGAALMEQNPEKFQDYLKKVPPSNSRDNLVAMAIEKIGTMDALAAYHLWKQERDEVASGTSGAKDFMLSKMIWNLAKQLDRQALEELVLSDDFLQATVGKADDVSLVLSQSNPDVAVRWVIEANATEEVKDHVVVDAFRGFVTDSRGERDAIWNYWQDYGIDMDEVVKRVGSDILRKSSVEGASFDELSERFGWILMEMPRMPESDPIIDAVAAAFVRKDVARALDWGDRIPEPALREAYFRNVSLEMRRRDLERPLEILDKGRGKEIEK